MEEMIQEILKQWEQAACNAMGSQFPKEEYFLKLTRETFEVLSHFDNVQTIPNSVARVLVLMQEYAVYCFISDEANSIEMWTIASGILYDFLNGFEQCSSIYPKLRLGDEYNVDFFDFDTNKLSDMKMNDEPPF
jgi:hypothetical protein